MFNQSLRSNRVFILLLISVPIFIGALDLTVVSAVLPHVIYDLEIPVQTGLDDAAWLVSGYLLAYSVAMTFMGRLSDLYGRRRVYLLALVIFAIGSYLVAVAEAWPTRVALRSYYLLFTGRPDPARVTLLMLIIARMIQAFGGGAMVPVGMALVGDLYPAGERAKPLGIIAAVDTAGWAVGHYYGGIVTYHLDWRTIFWLNLPICALAFLLVYFVLRDLPQKSHVRHMDWLGAVLITLGLTALNLGLGVSSEIGGGSFERQVAWPPYAVPSLILALLLIGAFLWRQVRAEHPLVPLNLFRDRNFSAASLANFLVGYSLFVAIANVPLFINTIVAETLDQGALDSGMILLALTVPMALAAFPGGWLTARKGYRWPALVGLAMAVVGFGLMNHWWVDTTYVTMIPHLAMTGLGFGLIMAPIAAAVVDAAPAEHRGTASALVIIFRLVGMTIGVSSITTYGLHRADVLNSRLLSATADLAEVAMEVAATVIDEAFLIAGLACVLAIYPISRLKRSLSEGSS
ncbi:MAG TPA: MFS transporter [Anaerolineae bacterium]|nr:MFS transporter [Anaerolineae bacterium]